MPNTWTSFCAALAACSLLVACSDSEQNGQPAMGAGAGGSADAAGGGAGISAGAPSAGAPSGAGAGGVAGSAETGRGPAAGSGVADSTAGGGGSGGRSSSRGRGDAGSMAGRAAGGGMAGAGVAGSAAGSGGMGGRAAAGAGGASGAGAMDCPMQGSISYELAKSNAPTAAEQAAYDRITMAMDRAVSIYNCYTNFTWRIRVTYVPTVATADGNVNGAIRFGSMESMNYITAMHETSHTLGVGGPQFQRTVMNGVFRGENATRKLREITGDAAAEIHADNQHFWPYGLNYTNEVKGMEDLITHCGIMIELRKDLGL